MEENVAESNGRVRVGLIGCGRIVEIEHLPAMLGSERVELDSAACPNEAVVFKFITLAQQPTSQLETAVWSGFVPPDTSVGSRPAFRHDRVRRAVDQLAGALQDVGRSAPTPVPTHGAHTFAGHAREHRGHRTRR